MIKVGSYQTLILLSFFYIFSNLICTEKIKMLTTVKVQQQIWVLKWVETQDAKIGSVHASVVGGDILGS